MPGFLEVATEGDGRAYIEINAIQATATQASSVDASGTKTSPTRVFLRSGQFIDVLGMSPGQVIAYAHLIRQQLREPGGPEFLVHYIAALPDA